MELTVERNGRKFNVDWKMMNRWCDVNQEFKVGDCCFVLEFSSPTISTDLIDDSIIIVGIVSFKLYKKPDLQMSNQQLPEVSVSKDEADFKVLTETSVNQWGPLSWEILPPSNSDGLTVVNCFRDDRRLINLLQRYKVLKKVRSFLLWFW